MKLVAKTLVLAAMLGGAVNLAHAEGNADAGKTKAAVCGACHGADGNSAVPSFPKLAGQNVRYLEKQLHDIKSGARQVLPMAGIVPGLSDQDIEDLAAYFSSQKVSIGAADPKLVERGQEIFRGGIKDAGVPALTVESIIGAECASVRAPHIPCWHPVRGAAFAPTA